MKKIIFTFIMIVMSIKTLQAQCKPIALANLVQITNTASAGQEKLLTGMGFSYFSEIVDDGVQTKVFNACPIKFKDGFTTHEEVLYIASDGLLTFFTLNKENYTQLTVDIIKNKKYEGAQADMKLYSDSKYVYVLRDAIIDGAIGTKAHPCWSLGLQIK